MKTIPCKTFLVGEYAVLDGGEALGIATGPGFVLSSDLMNYHPDSAVSLYLGQTQFSRVQSIAPGGFGKSTAEFIFAYLQKVEFPKFELILSDYLRLFDQSPKQRPSGADVVIQCLGGISHIASDKNKSHRIGWPFPDLGFLLVSTGLKIATHQHLKELDRSLIKHLPTLSLSVIEAFKKADQELFFKTLNNWKKALEQKGLTHPEVLKLMENLRQNIATQVTSEFIIKQCGAFGADVMIIIFEKNKKDDITKILKRNGLSIVATENDLMDGALV